MLTYSEHILKICVAQLAKYAGWKSINSASFEILIDILSRFILEFGKLSVSFANHCNRTQVNFDDISFVLKSMRFNLVDLYDYLENVKLPFAGPLIPQYPVENPFKKQIRIQFPTRVECKNRSEFYQDWQPTLNSNNYLSEFETNQEIENTLEQIDLVDFIEKKHNLKITEDLVLNQKIVQQIKSNISKLNIGSFTELNALVPNYIYLSADGQALSFGGKEGKLPEARLHNQISPNKDPKLLVKIKNSKSSKRKKSSKKSNELIKFNEPELPFKLVIKKNKKIDKLSSTTTSKPNPLKRAELRNCNQLSHLKFKQDHRQSIKTDEQIVSELLNEMVSHIEDNKLNESFYDENEAAKTLVLLSYDSSSKGGIQSANNSRLIDEENQIDYSKLNNKLNYDLNNNYPSISDLNNNNVSGTYKNSNGFSNNNNSNSKLDKNADYEPFKLYDVKNLTIKDSSLDEEDNKCLTNKMNNSNNLPKLKFKLSFDKYKKGDALSLANNLEYIHPSSNQPIKNHFNHSTINSNLTKKLDSHPKTPTKEDKRKKKSKKLDNLTNDHPKNEINSSKTKTKKNKEKDISEKIYYCPNCSKPDDGTPMIACDQCNSWYHWSCQNIFSLPKEEEWFCSNCSQFKNASKKSNKKIKSITVEKSNSDKKPTLNKKSFSDNEPTPESKKRSKEVQLEEDKKLLKSLNKKKQKIIET